MFDRLLGQFWIIVLEMIASTEIIFPSLYVSLKSIQNKKNTKFSFLKINVRKFILWLFFPYEVMLCSVWYLTSYWLACAVSCTRSRLLSLKKGSTLPVQRTQLFFRQTNGLLYSVFLLFFFWLGGLRTAQPRYASANERLISWQWQGFWISASFFAG